MKGVKKMISILVRIISITRLKLPMLPKAKKPIILLAKWVYLLVSIIKLLMNEMRLGTYNCTKSVLDTYSRGKISALLKHLCSKS
jgi:hypothetical protein